MSPSGMPCCGHRGQHGDERGDGVAPAGRQQSSGGRVRGRAGRCSSGTMTACRQVVAEEQLVIVAQQVVLAVPPGRLGVGAVAGPARRGPGEGLQVAPVHGQRRAGVLELLPGRMASSRSSQTPAVPATAARPAGPWPARPSPGRRCTRPAGRSAGAGRSSSPPGRRAAAGRPRAGRSAPGGPGSGAPGRPSASASRMPSSRVRTDSCRARAPDGSRVLDPRRDAGGVDDLLQARQRGHGRAAPSRATASSSLPGSSPAIRSPSRWEQLIPAACMNVASPSCSAAAGQPGGPQPGGVQPRQPAPAVQRR